MTLKLIALLILSSSSLTASYSSRGSDASQTGDENAIIRIEDTIVKAWLKHDTVTIEPFIADDFQSWSFKGQRRGKPELLRSVTNTEETDTKVEDAKVNLYGDTAVYTGRITDRGFHDGKPFSITTCVTHVFVRRNRRWQMVASAEQIVGPERG